MDAEEEKSFTAKNAKAAKKSITTGALRQRQGLFTFLRGPPCLAVRLYPPYRL